MEMIFGLILCRETVGGGRMLTIGVDGFAAIVLLFSIFRVEREIKIAIIRLTVLKAVTAQQSKHKHKAQAEILHGCNLRNIWRMLNYCKRLTEKCMASE